MRIILRSLNLFLRQNFYLILKKHLWRYKHGIKALDYFIENRRTFVNYECDVCGYIGKISKSHYDEGAGCSVCSGKTVIRGVNDLATTNPELASLVVPKTDAFLYTNGSGKRITIRCDRCGFQKKISVAQLVQRGFKCPLCFNGKSMPSRLMAAILRECNIRYEPEKQFGWSKKYRYDFYLPDYDTIVEVNGGQHYKPVKAWTPLEKVKESDDEKVKLAIENSVHNYVIIKADISDMDYVMNRITESDIFLITGIDASKIDFKRVYELLKTGEPSMCVDLWNSGIRNTREIAEMVGISAVSVAKYLKRYAEVGICDYSPLEQILISQKAAAKKRRTKVVCVNTGEVFESINDAAEKYNIKPNAIQNCVAGRSKHSGRDTRGNKLHWEYYLGGN